jgi:hypothetical protein
MYNYAEILPQCGESIRNLVAYVISMSDQYKAKSRLNMLSGDEHQHTINYSPINIKAIFDYVISSKTIIAKPSGPIELTVYHLHSFICLSGHPKWIGLMSAKGKSDACVRRYVNGNAKSKSDWEEKLAEFEAYV